VVGDGYVQLGQANFLLATAMFHENVAGYHRSMTAYDPDTGFRNGSFAQRNPGAYFVIFGVIYAAIWFGLSMAGHHAKTGKYVMGAVIGSIILGALIALIHFGVWRWRTARGERSGRTAR
jgi:hypothetical protein